MNAEIVARLEKSFDNDSSLGGIITLLDTAIESAVSRALERNKKAAIR